MYETFDHTADLGLRIRAESVERLFEEAAEALSALLVVNLQQVEPVQEENLQLQAGSLEDLLHDWLSELLVMFELRKLVGRRFQVRLSRQSLPVAGPPAHMGAIMGEPIALHQEVLHGTIWGEPFDPARHQLGHEVKAITYHGLCVEKHPEGWLAELILDL